MRTFGVARFADPDSDHLAQLLLPGLALGQVPCQVATLRAEQAAGPAVRRRAAPDDLDVAIRTADMPLADAGHHLGARRRLAALFAEDAEVDIVTWGDDGLILTLTVMIRPLSGLVTLREAIAAQLTADGSPESDAPGG